MAFSNQGRSSRSYTHAGRKVPNRVVHQGASAMNRPAGRSVSRMGRTGR